MNSLLAQSGGPPAALPERIAAIFAPARARAQADRRADMLALFRQSWQDGRARVRAQLEETPRLGLGAAAALSALQDRIVTTLFDAVCAHVFPRANPTRGEVLALAATGGYGRGLLAPESDIDILFLHPYKPTAWSESVIEYMLYILWDLGLKTGHAARSPEDCVRQARADMTVRTSLLDARFLRGDQSLYDDFARRFARQVAGKQPRAFVAAKLAERDRRHLTAGSSRYLVEPNVKDGKGGLRDLQTIGWIASYCYGGQRSGWFTAAEQRRFRSCETLLWAVRCHLHFLTGRAEERLSFDVQKDLARLAGFKSKSPVHELDAVERFMKKYFLTAKYVGDLTRLLCAQLEDQQKKPRLRLPALLRRGLRAAPRLPPGLTLEGGRIGLRADFVFEGRALTLLHLFHAAAVLDLDIRPEALRRAARARVLIDSALRADMRANRLFLDILTSPRAAERVLRLMNEAGVLGRFIPDFGRIVALMQFNMYHHYTADEHLLRAVGQLAQIERGQARADAPLASELMRGIAGTPTAAALYLAVFLHDIAKGRGGDHSLLGAKIARRLAPRMGLDSAHTTLVAWLVEHHLIMSDTAQRRDVSDPKTTADFARMVQTPERLDLLLILTVADIRAVGPGVWNGWKGQLLRTLYLHARAALTGKAHTLTAPEGPREQLALLLADWPKKTLARYLALHGSSYWSALDGDSHLRHARLWARLWRGETRSFAFSAHDDQFRSVTEIAILTDDHPGLFARLAGALAIGGLRIVDAKIFTARNGTAFDTFWVQDRDGRALCDPRRIERQREIILDVLAGRLHPARELTARPARIEAFHVDPAILIDNRASADHSVIEVATLDRPGLLHALARVILDMGLIIVSAHIATFGERAVDVFYAKDAAGQKIAPRRWPAIRRRLRAAIGDPPPPGQLRVRRPK